MSVTASVPAQASPPAASNSYDRLRSFVRIGQGHFSLGFADFNLIGTPKQLNARLRADLPELNIVTVELAAFPVDAPADEHVYDQLRQWVQFASPDRAPDALLISGFDAMMDQDFWRAVEPLNRGRNLLQRDYSCPVLFWLREKHMGQLWNSAPDFVSWSALQVHFRTDLAELEARCRKAGEAPFGWIAWLQLRLQSKESRRTLAAELDEMLRDAEAAHMQGTFGADVTALLRRRLSLVLLSLGDPRAPLEFAAFERNARVAENREWIREAEWGLRRSGPPEVEPDAFTGFTAGPVPGAAGLAAGDPVIGRVSEVENLVARVMDVTPRFQIVWGESGSGKSALVRAGLVPRLEKLGMKAVVIDAYDNLEAQVSVHLPPPDGKTTVFVFDQFERLFHGHSGEARAAALGFIGRRLVRDLDIHCRAVIVVREDDLGRMAEFDKYIPEPLEACKRFHVPHLDRRAAMAVLTSIAQRHGLPWTADFVATVADDLASDGRIRPIDLRLAAAALSASGIHIETELHRAGGARVVLNGFMDRLIRTLPRVLDGDQWRRLLLVFLDDGNRRQRLRYEEILALLKFTQQQLAPALAALEQAAILWKVEGAYELTHDELTRHIERSTRTLRDKMELASIWQRQSMDRLWVHPWTGHMTLDEALLVRRYPELWSRDPRAADVVRRSLWLGAIGFICKVAGLGTVYWLVRFTP